MEEFVNFCEDTIFEMQLAADISEETGSAEDEEEDDDDEAEDDISRYSFLIRLQYRVKFTCQVLIQMFTWKFVKKATRLIRNLTIKDFLLFAVILTYKLGKGALQLIYKLLCTLCENLMIYLFSGSMVEMAKETTISGFIRHVPEPTHDGIGSRYEDEEEEEENPEGEEGAVEEVDDIIQPVEPDTSSDGPSAFVEFIDNNQKEIGFGDQDFDEAARSLGMEYDEDTFNAQEEIRLKRQRRRQSAGEQYNQIEVQRHSVSRVNQREVLDTWDHYKEHCERPAKYRETVDVQEKASVVRQKIRQFTVSCLAFFARNFYNFKSAALLISFAMNFILLSYKWERPESSDEFCDAEDCPDAEDAEEVLVFDEWIPDNIEDIIHVIGVIHTILSVSKLIAYYQLKVPLVMFKREKEISRKLEFDGLYISVQPSDEDLAGQWDRLVISCPSFPLTYWDKFIKKKVLEKFGGQYDKDKVSDLLGLDTTQNLNISPKQRQEQEEAAEKNKGTFSSLIDHDWRYGFWKAGVVWTDRSFLYLFAYVILSFAGHINPFFYAAHLLDVAFDVKSLQTIMASVTHNGKQFMLTVGLLTVVIYLYTVLAFNFFRGDYNKGEDGEDDYKCNDMLSCFQFNLYAGVRAGGGIGDELEAPQDEDFYLRFAFDITFFFFIIVIMLAIIQGLIIDAFGELRDQQEQVKDDMESKCFICTLGKEYFDQVPHGFETHTMQEHNLANYLFFLMHLINKDETEFTGQETFVWKLYQERCWDFFPVGDCFRKQYESEFALHNQ